MEIYEERPPSVVVTKLKKHYTTFNFDVEEVEGGFTCQSVTVESEKTLTAGDYGKVVAAIVRSRYSADDVEAIVNNYVSSKTAEHKAEWNALQAWRTKAKEVASVLTTNE